MGGAFYWQRKVELKVKCEILQLTKDRRKKNRPSSHPVDRVIGERPVHRFLTGGMKQPLLVSRATWLDPRGRVGVHRCVSVFFSSLELNASANAHDSLEGQDSSLAGHARVRLLRRLYIGVSCRVIKVVEACDGEVSQLKLVLMLRHASPL